jgi:hypothetical protein
VKIDIYIYLELLGNFLNLLEFLSYFDLLNHFLLVFLVYEQVHLELEYFYFFQFAMQNNVMTLTLGLRPRQGLIKV